MLSYGICLSLSGKTVCRASQHLSSGFLAWASAVWNICDFSQWRNTSGFTAVWNIYPGTHGVFWKGLLQEEVSAFGTGDSLKLYSLRLQLYTWAAGGHEPGVKPQGITWQTQLVLMLAATALQVCCDGCPYPTRIMASALRCLGHKDSHSRPPPHFWARDHLLYWRAVVPFQLSGLRQFTLPWYVRIWSESAR